MIAEQATVDASELWYVAMAPGETKVLTLEQLDDLFRLDIIDAGTRVWQPGMAEWLPLSVVAGLEAPEPVTSQAPPHSARRPVAAPPPPPQRQRAQLHAVPAPAPSAPPPAPRKTGFAQTVDAWPPVALQSPAAANSWPPAAAPSPAAASAWPPVAVQSPSFAPARVATPAPVESFRPLVVSSRPSAAKSGGAAGRIVVAFALLAGVGVTLYRNDVLHQAARSAGQEATYLQLERALGGPGFGTPRAIQVLTDAQPTLAAAALTPSATSTALGHDSSALGVTKPSTSTTTTTTTPPSPTPSEPTQNVTPEPSHASTSATTPARTTTAATPRGSSASSKAATSERRSSARSEARSSASRPSSRSEASSGAEPSKRLGFKGSTNAYDPLNGNL